MASALAGAMRSTLDVVLVAASPSADSRSSKVLAALGAQVEAEQLSVRAFALRDFDPGDLLYGRTDAPRVAELLRAVERARALVVATPVYKGVYSGGLKAIVDLIPPDGLTQKVVLGVATAKLEAHAYGVERAFAELFQFFRGSVPLDTLALLDAQLRIEAGRLGFDADAERQFARAAGALIAALR
jgi:FMN reductase